MTKDKPTRSVRLIVTHPSTGRFTARILRNSEEKQINLSVTLLEKFIKSRLDWGSKDPSIEVEDIEDDQG